MSVPSKRKSSSRTKRGRSHDARPLPKLIKSKETGKLVMPHRIDPITGTYKGRQVIKLKTKKSKSGK